MAQAEHYVDELEASRDRFRQSGRAAMGVSGADHTEPLLAALKRYKVGLYPVAALGLLAIVDQFQVNALVVLGPEVRRALGLSKVGLTFIVLLTTIALSLAALPMAAFSQSKPRRALIAKVTAFSWTAVTLLAGFVTSAWQLAVVTLMNGVSQGSVASVHNPLLTDTYPPALRARVLHGWRGLFTSAGIISPLLVAFLAGPMELTWRGVLLGMGVVCFFVSLFALGLRDPGVGKWDAERLRAEVRSATSVAAADSAPQHRLRFAETVRRLIMIPTVRRVLVAEALLGMLVSPLLTYVSFFLEERWGLSPDKRGLFFAGATVIPVITVGAVSRFNERLLQRNPAQLFVFGAVAQMVAGVAIAVAVGAPTLWLTFIGIGAFSGALAARLAAGSTVFYSVIRPEMRSHASALSNIFLYGVGGFAGLMLLGGLDQRYGIQGAIASMFVPLVLSSVALRGAARTVDADLDRLVDDLVEEEELGEMAARGVHLPMLACRKLDFAYGQLQVLFGVDFTVDDGEMVALLGTNGAGKSTLLRVVSGLGLPSRGSVRFRGSDITYLDAERRVGLGITQVPGGRAVFGPMTVVENLRVFAYTHGGDRREVDRGIDESFAAFPRLAERRTSLAATLSGGEQQMLGLAKALILKPRLLLIDELSLGLAPKVVSELLGMVRTINTRGTAVVLVEQSVNVALSLVNHAYFMEKGEIRFDGKADELVNRGDLLRSVFLEGAATGIAKIGRKSVPGARS